MVDMAVETIDFQGKGSPSKASLEQPEGKHRGGPPRENPPKPPPLGGFYKEKNLKEALRASFKLCSGEFHRGSLTWEIPDETETFVKVGPPVGGAGVWLCKTPQASPAFKFALRIVNIPSGACLSFRGATISTQGGLVHKPVVDGLPKGRIVVKGLLEGRNEGPSYPRSAGDPCLYRRVGGGQVASVGRSFPTFDNIPKGGALLPSIREEVPRLMVVLPKKGFGGFEATLNPIRWRFAPPSRFPGTPSRSEGFKLIFVGGSHHFERS
ncbi:hypothetical protein RRG08_015264 [Elysia crispata]|uniref:Uncharacterized protein n=1 Tax=Elysia crispata TaxID=231223 RepID=A0AAE1AV54_9GAST|nr:hypothetical protein RRG08_015264 [Elysia crispata]